MSEDGSIELVFAGDLRTFRLGIAELLALEDKRNSGSLEIAVRLQFGNWRLPDITETIRIGLIGGGTDGKVAKELVDENVKPGHITEHVLTAQAVIMVALQGVPEDPVGKDEAAVNAPGTKNSPLPPSTETVQ